MFCKDKSCTTKGEQDIILGIFRNRGNTKNTQILEYLVKHNHIKSHREAWKIKEKMQSDSIGITVDSKKTTEEYKRMMDDSTKNINDSNILKISNYSKNSGFPVVSKTGKFKGKISVISNSKLLRHSGSEQDSNPLFSQPMHRSNFLLSRNELCSKCQLPFQSKPKSKRNCNPTQLIAPPNSPADDAYPDVLEESDRNKSKIYQMNLVGKRYKASELSSEEESKMSSNKRKHAPEPARRSINVFIPFDGMGGLLT